MANIKKILLTNVHTYENKGDYSIIWVTIEKIRSKFPNSVFYLISSYPEHDRGKYFDCEVFGALIPYPNLRHRMICRLIEFMKDVLCVSVGVLIYKLLKVNIFLGEKKKIFNLYLNADVLVGSGGRSFFSFGKYPIGLSYLCQASQLFIGKILGKEFIIYGQSIGPFGSFFSRWIASFVLKGAEYIFVRDEISKIRSLEIGIDEEKVSFSPDLAFGLSLYPHNLEEAGRLRNNRIGVSVRYFDFFFSRSKNKLYDNYLDSFVEFLNQIIIRDGKRVIFISQVIGPEETISDDRVVAREVIAKIDDNCKEFVELDEKDYDLVEIMDLYRSLDILIGARMHSNIFALSNFVPVIGISCGEKIPEMMRYVDLEEFVVDVEDMKAEHLMEKYNLVMNSYNDIQNKIEKRILKLRKDCDFTVEKLSAMLSEIC